MAKDDKSKQSPPEDQTAEISAEGPTHENRIDDFGVAAFERMGYTGRLPDSLVQIYKQFKLRKDALVPGRVSPEGFAFMTVLSDMVDRRIEL